MGKRQTFRDDIPLSLPPCKMTSEERAQTPYWWCVSRQICVCKNKISTNQRYVISIEFSDFIGCVRSCTDFSSVLRPGINHFCCRVPRPRQLPFIHEWGISLVNKLYVTESKHRHSFAVIILLLIIIIIISWHFIDVNNKYYNYCYMHVCMKM